MSRKDAERWGLSFPLRGRVRGPGRPRVLSHPGARRRPARTAPLRVGSRPRASSSEPRAGRGWRPTAADSPEKPVAALALVGEADEGVHGATRSSRRSQGTAGLRAAAARAGPGLSAHMGGGHTFGSAATWASGWKRKSWLLRQRQAASLCEPSCASRARRRWRPPASAPRGGTEGVSPPAPGVPGRSGTHDPTRNANCSAQAEDPKSSLGDRGLHPSSVPGPKGLMMFLAGESGKVREFSFRIIEAE